MSQDLTELTARRSAIAAKIDVAESALAQLRRDRALVEAQITAAKEQADREVLPCWSCKTEQAADVRALLGGSTEPFARSPTSGLPLGCCRLQIAAVVGTSL